ncbi:MAG: MFS transporter [Chloroflexi bacterium]|nr:MFS transporter [Chloroflexota bacterium]MDA1270665.1 MFS transporter [Chloroflexota bacterium]
MNNLSLAIAKKLSARLPFYYGWVVVFAAGTTVFARMAPSTTTLAVFVSPLADEFGWSRTLIAGAVSVGALSSIFISPIVGMAVDRYGARLILTGSMVVLGVAMISLAWATVPVFFYMGFATGRIIFHVPVQIGSGALISRWFIRKRGRAVGVIYLAGAIGGVVTIQTASLAISHWSISAAWITLGVLVLAIAVLPSALFIVERPEDICLRPDNDPNRASDDRPNGLPEEPVINPAEIDSAEIDWSLRDAMGTRSLWVLTFVVGTLFMVQAGISVHVGAFFLDRGLTLTAAAMAITVNAIMNAVASLAWGVIVERTAVRWAMTGLMLISGVCSLALLSVDSVPTAFAVAALLGIVGAGGNVIPPVAFASYFGRRSIGSIRGVSETGVQVGQTFGALFSGLVFDLSGSYVIAFLTFSALGFAGAVVVNTSRPPVSRHAS